MTALSTMDYDLRQIEPEDDKLDVSDWDLISSINPNKSYKIIDTIPIDYFDYRERYKVSSAKDRSNIKYAYCVFFNSNSGSFQEDLLADFYYMQDLSKRYSSLFTFEDICLEQTEDGLRAAFIHSQSNNQNPNQIPNNTILNCLSSLIDSQQLIPILIKLFEFLSNLRDAYFSELEIENINILISQLKEDKYQFFIVNQILPLHYRIEFLKDLYAIYEEEEIELNETLLVKKTIFLMITLATEKGLEGYQQIRNYLDLWKKQQIQLPKKPIQYELLKLGLNLTKKLEHKEKVTIAYVIDSLIEIQERLTQKNKLSLKSIQQNSKKRTSQETIKSNKLQRSEQESSQVQDYDNFEEEEENDEDEDKEDFICVPVNNMDHNSVHIKLVDEDKGLRSQNIYMDNESENANNGYQSDVMRSQQRLGWSQSANIRTNKYEEQNPEGGKTTVINIEQIRLQQPSTGRNKDREDDSERNEEDIVIIANQQDELQSKPLKGGAQLINALFKQPQFKESDIQLERKTVAYPNIYQKREQINYKRYACSQTIKNAHSEKINCICSLRNGTFATGSSDKTLKIWNAFKQTPLAILEEDDEITHLIKIGKVQQNDIALLYVANKVIRILSLRQQKAVKIFRNEKKITSITQIASNKNIVAFGTENGMVKDLDIKSKNIIRRIRAHEDKEVTSIISQGKYLISASTDGLIVIYDYQSQQLHRELNVDRIGLSNPTSLYVFKGEEYLAIANEKNFSIINIETTTECPTLGNVNITKLVKLQIPSENKQQAFVGLNSQGVVKIYAEGLGEFNKWIETMKVMKHHMGEVTDICSLPNGALVSCGIDKSLCFYEEKKSNAACACCNIF